MRDRWRYLRGRHPATCTCAECTSARRKRSRPSPSRWPGWSIPSRGSGPVKPPVQKQSQPNLAQRPRPTIHGRSRRPGPMDRMRWTFRRWRYRLSRWNRGFWGTLKWLAVRVVAMALLVTVAVIVYHWYDGAPLESAVRMTTDDYRLIFECPADYEVLLDFVRRPSPPEYYYRMRDRYGADWAQQVCDGDIAYGDTEDLTRSGEDRDALGIATPREAETVVPLASELPPVVFDQFLNDFYFDCPSPRRTDLTILRSWSSAGDATLRFIPPGGTHFLVVVATTTGPGWRLDCVLNSHGRRHQPLYLDSSVPERLSDAQAWCTRGLGTSPDSVLDIESRNLDWTVFLVATDGDEPVPEAVMQKLDGFYDLCPPRPLVQELTATVLASATTSTASIPFQTSPPHYFIGVHFQPDARNWFFRSADSGGNWSAPGPRVTSGSTELIDFTAIYPQSAGSHHLEIEARGGHWTVYLITVTDQ